MSRSHTSLHRRQSQSRRTGFLPEWRGNYNIVTARIERAQNYLLTSSLTIGQIAERLGYSSVYFFHGNSSSIPELHRANSENRTRKAPEQV
ncbi:MAG: hypothetical protein WC959_12640 [Kiritimatiellales bacterium]